MDIKGIKVISISDSLADVFVGDGWYNWTRVLKKNGKFHILGGNKLHSIIYKYLDTEVFKK